MTTIHYLIRKELAPVKAMRIISAILTAFDVSAVDGAAAREALLLPFADFAAALGPEMTWIALR